MADVQVTSKQYSINWKDTLKGGLVAAIMSVATIVEEALRAGGFAAIDWAMVGSIAFGTFMSYMIKNFLSPAAIQKTVTNEEVEKLKPAIEAGTVDIAAKP